MQQVSQLDFIAALREEELDHGILEESQVASEPVSLSLEAKMADLDYKDLKVLFFGPEGLSVTHQDVTVYKTQLFGKSANGGASAALQERQNARQVLLSDETGVSSIDRGRLDAVLNQLHFDLQPQVRGWTMSANPETLAAQYYNYGLNDKLFHEFLEQQVLLRLNRVVRQHLSVPQAHMQPQPQPQPLGPPPPSQSIYVTNFPIEWTQQELATLFGNIGAIESVAIMTGRRGYGTRGAAFVNFLRQDDAARSIEQLNGLPAPGREDMRLNVNYARSRVRV